MILVECEQFAEYGGWVIDQQFMDQMGSPYLMAHGLGARVSDATTLVSIPAGGEYRVWVRTFDWAAPWISPVTEHDAPGRFQLLINGKPLAKVFGAEGATWHWQDGGVIQLPVGRMMLSLHDLTGFEGRCDAILFSEVLDFVPPNEGAALAGFRRELLGLSGQVEGGSYDLVVVGAGVAGMCAALVAARRGLSVALVHDRPVPGGNNSSEVRVNIANNEFCLAPFPLIGSVVRELDQTRKAAPGPDNVAENFEDNRRLDLLRAEPRLTVLFGKRVVDVLKEHSVITAVIAQDIYSGQRIRVSGAFFADCTGDGDIGFLAGADYDMQQTGHMGPSNIWNIVDTGVSAPFPSCPWALDLKDKPFPGRSEHVGQWAGPGIDSLGHWFWESGFDLNPVAEGERIRDSNLRAMYGAWDALKNADQLYPNHKLTWAAYIAGKRESRRLLGEVIISRGDLFRQTCFPDACVPCTWHMDVHVPHREYQRGFEGEEFISWCNVASFPTPFWLPFRALYSRNVDNLFMAGRNISVTHEALGGIRVQRTTGMMGEVVGLAASMCVRRRTLPRTIYADFLEEFQEMLKRPF